LLILEELLLLDVVANAVVANAVAVNAPAAAAVTSSKPKLAVEHSIYDAHDYTDPHGTRIHEEKKLSSYKARFDHLMI
jgi:hypothetical protein